MCNKSSLIIASLICMSFNVFASGFTGPNAKENILLTGHLEKPIRYMGFIIEKEAQDGRYLFQRQPQSLGTMTVNIPNSLMNKYSITPSTPLTISGIDCIYRVGHYVSIDDIKVNQGPMS